MPNWNRSDGNAFSFRQSTSLCGSRASGPKTAGAVCAGRQILEKRRLRALFAMTDQDDDDKHVEHVEVAHNGRPVEVNVTVGRVKVQVLVTFKQPPGADSTPAKDQS